MDKKQAEDAINFTYQTIIKKLHAQKNFNPCALLNDLHQLEKALQSGDAGPLQLHSGQHEIEKQYKAIAEESLHSYTQTKESVELINQKQQRLIEDSQDSNELNISQVIKNFNDVHTQIETEMINANETIKALHKQIKVLEKDTTIDPLTHAYNRRALEEHINTICASKEEIADTRIILIDIDDFKAVNDTYGHLAGDRVLVFLSKLLASSLREGDKLFRFGGEEFLISLHGSNEKTCKRVAERILEAVRSNTLLYKDRQIKITLSMGATHLKEGDSYESFLERADQALYQAKENGKDQIVAG